MVDTKRLYNSHTQGQGCKMETPGTEEEYCTIDTGYLKPSNERGDKRLQGQKDARTRPRKVQKQKRKGPCMNPPCWAWVLIVIGAVVIAAVVTSVVFLFFINIPCHKDADPENNVMSTVGPNVDPVSSRPGEDRTPVIVTGTPASSKQGVQDVAIIFCDSQGSQDDWLSLLDFVTNILRLLQNENQSVRVALVRNDYSTAEVVHNFSDDQDIGILEERVRSITASQSPEEPDVVKGLQLVRKDIFRQSAGDRLGAPNVLMTIMRAFSVRGLTQALRDELMQLKKNAKVVPVGLSPAVDDEALEVFASHPESIIHAENRMILDTITDQVFRAICEKMNIFFILIITKAPQ